MVAINQILKEIESLPKESLQEVLDFIGYLKLKKISTTAETMILSEKALSDWNTPEEEEAWKNL